MKIIVGILVALPLTTFAIYLRGLKSSFVIKCDSIGLSVISSPKKYTLIPWSDVESVSLGHIAVQNEGRSVYKTFRIKTNKPFARKKSFIFPDTIIDMTSKKVIHITSILIPGDLEEHIKIINKLKERYSKS